MAKRRRLDPSLFGKVTTEVKPASTSRAPIAQVSGDSAAAGALNELAAAFERARSEGRMVQEVPLDSVQADYLLRDRLAVDEEALADLTESIRARGQQTPIEVVQLEDGYGLISGWRRLEALRRLHAETGSEAFATVQALLRRPAEASDAYQAMVEENEIRVGLSYYERARIAARAVEAGIYPDRQKALRGLFATASRARRSKISSFMVTYDALDGILRFPTAIPERLGLKLAKALDANPDLAAQLRERLDEAQPGNPAAEMTILTSALTASATRSTWFRSEEVRPGVFVEISERGGRSKIVLSGSKVDESLREQLVSWLERNQ